MRPALAFVLALVGVLAHAGTLTVSSPTQGSFLGTSNQVKFIIRGATLEVEVRVQATGPGGTTTVQRKFTPNRDGEVTGEIPLNFSPSTPEGAYTLTVTATEPSNTYNTVVINTTVDVTKPKFRAVSPLANSFVKGVVPITVKLDEPNVKEWRVQINGQDIPNNTGDSQNFVVNWDTSGIIQDGPQTVNIRVEDEAGNEATRTFTLTVDRVAPVVTIQHPRSDTRVRLRSRVPVVIDIADGAPNSVHPTGIDAIVTTLDGTFIQRVPQERVQTVSGNVLRFTGRLRWRNEFRNGFKIRVNAVDKAGNVAAEQEVTVQVRR
jgi:hypothetical protein